MARIPAKSNGISVVLTTYNRATLLQNQLTALSKQTLSRKKIDILIIDDGSTDSTKQVVEKFIVAGLPARYVRQNHAGLSAGRNKGISLAKHRVVAFTDDDCLAEPQWLEELLTTFNREHPVGIEGRIRTDANPPLFSNAPENAHGGKYIGCNIAYDREILVELKGFDPAFDWVRDDSDLAFRALKKGKIVFAENAVMYHPARPVHWDHLLQRLKIVRSDVRLYKKHSEKFVREFGMLGQRNLAQSAVSWAFVVGLVYASTYALALPALALLLAYGAWRYVVSMRAKTFSIFEGVLFTLTLLVRDLIYPCYLAYYYLTTSPRAESVA